MPKPTHVSRQSGSPGWHKNRRRVRDGFDDLAYLPGSPDVWDATLVACAYADQVYTSADSGTTWTAQTTAGIRNWHRVASSADGTKLVACVLNGRPYTFSEYLVQTTPGTSGSVTGGALDALEIQYIGDDTWRPLSYVGDLDAE